MSRFADVLARLAATIHARRGGERAYRSFSPRGEKVSAFGPTDEGARGLAGGRPFFLRNES